MTSARAAGRGRRMWVAAFVGGVALFALTGCSLDDVPNQIAIPDPVTDSGDRIFHLWQATWVALWAIGIFTWALMLGAAFWFRRRREDYVPKQTRYNLPIEVMYTVTPLIVILVFAWPTIRDSDIITEVSGEQDQTINVVGYQWEWGFNYIDEDVYSVGSPADPPTLYLPVDQKTQFVLTSPDVIHSFWVPDFLFKLDVVPGRANTFELVPTDEGRYEGKCAEMCGTYHSQMLFWVEVVDQATFDAKMEELREAGQTGQLETGRPDTGANDLGKTRIGDDS
ncbi:MAG TPA: cytochrome c oxidase subunit II [Actinomycetes bacterium]|nr:cytochrome c oxidase subunit II [Actinomycetes bacterium]